MKLDRPVEVKVSDLDLTSFMSGPLQPDCRPRFDLYAVVNHFGTVGGGHYTAYARHKPTKTWNYFDDCSVQENKCPDDIDSHQSAAYVLFYQRRGNL